MLMSFKDSRRAPLVKVFRHRHPNLTGASRDKRLRETALIHQLLQNTSNDERSYEIETNILSERSSMSLDRMSGSARSRLIAS